MADWRPAPPRTRSPSASGQARSKSPAPRATSPPAGPRSDRGRRPRSGAGRPRFLRWREVAIERIDFRSASLETRSVVTSAMPPRDLRTRMSPASTRRRRTRPGRGYAVHAPASVDSSGRSRVERHAGQADTTQASRIADIAPEGPVIRGRWLISRLQSRTRVVTSEHLGGDAVTLGVEIRGQPWGLRIPPGEYENHREARVAEEALGKAFPTPKPLPREGESSVAIADHHVHFKAGRRCPPPRPRSPRSGSARGGRDTRRRRHGPRAARRDRSAASSSGSSALRGSSR